MSTVSLLIIPVKRESLFCGILFSNKYMQSKTPDKKAPAGASPAPAANRTKGILFILSAAFFFSLMTVFVRLSGDVPTMQKAFFRNIVAAFLAAFILMRSGEKFYIPRTSLLDMFLRCSIGTMGILCNFWAVDHMRIADANILNKLSPFFAILMSIFILKERPNRVEWLSVLLAFIGAAFVAKPGAGIASFPAAQASRPSRHWSPSSAVSPQELPTPLCANSALAA